ncbi:HDOD domain-containing protein [Denitratisoma sp. DHT3]|uniref:HDOD domain-containing protein n=1 Tax=Denitratisoma sp. DHT3 TaxID=1981880 RepID=UPI0021BD3746|nr:HDOD domain-containing protein [Denitratisoma sp. DHT3]
MVAVDKMPAFPRSVQKVLELTRNINCLPRELVAVIEKDPVMTMKILKVINSAYYSLPSKITSINQSVVYLGINTIKNLSLSFAAVGILPLTNTAGFDTQRYLVHSLATAATARQLCAIYAKGEADPGDCYVAGLLHDFGKVVFAQFLADEFREALEASMAGRFPLYQAERQIIGADHGVVGAMLAKRWQFPEHLVGCIHDHHQEEAEPSAMMDCLRVADQICRGNELGDDIPVDRKNQMPAAPRRFGDDLAKVVAALGDFEKIIAEARTFVAVDGEK